MNSFANDNNNYIMLSLCDRSISVCDIIMIIKKILGI